MPPGLANKGEGFTNPGRWFQSNPMQPAAGTTQPQMSGGGQPTAMPTGALNAQGLEQFQNRFQKMPWARSRGLFGF